jgi:para-aminobenzoate synthetase component 1
MGEPWAWIGGSLASDLVEISHDPACLNRGGRWFAVLPFDGLPTFCRFARWERAEVEPRPWDGPGPWRTSLDRETYCRAVSATREAIAAGTVYQANICRVLRAPTSSSSVSGLFARLLAGNPAPYAAAIEVPEIELAIASASPELFLRREGDVLTSGPIKGTAATAEGLQEKDRAENIMIVDLVRNDLGRVCEPGTIHVPRFLETESHPGLVHLVSDIQGQVRAGVEWTDIFAATFPPGSVTGTPKSSALDLIDTLEPVSREIYCGALGWIDANTTEASLAVAIRTFWLGAGDLCFGTGAGITWGSDPVAEWEETELKAARLIGLTHP